MKLIKLNATDSTNSYLKNLSKESAVDDETVVIAKTQHAGRGQRGATWVSVAGQSLTFSIYKRFCALSPSRQFAISMAVSLGIKKALNALGTPGVSVKWPNDIMSYSQKLGGILIETQTAGGDIKAAVIGIGINVNETKFPQLPEATSMFLASGIKFNVKEVSERVMAAVLFELRLLETHDFQELKETYEASLFRKDTVSFFEDALTNKFNGIIRGTNDLGKLLIELESGRQREFGLKEIKMLHRP